MLNLQAHYHIKLDFQKVDQHTGDKWLIHGTKHHKTISCKAWDFPAEYPNIESKRDIKESESNIFNPECKRNVQGWKHINNISIFILLLYYYRCGWWYS